MLPMLVGMGVDNGVHLVHRHRTAPDEIDVLASSTDRRRGWDRGSRVVASARMVRSRFAPWVVLAAALARPAAGAPAGHARDDGAQAEKGDDGEGPVRPAPADVGRMPGAKPSAKAPAKPPETSSGDDDLAPRGPHRSREDDDLGDDADLRDDPELRDDAVGGEDDADTDASPDVAAGDDDPDAADEDDSYDDGLADD